LILGTAVGWVFGCLSSLVAIAIITPFALTALIPLGYFYRYVQKYYAAVSREVKRIDSMTRSPIYSLFGETLAGLSTIRAYQRQQKFIQVNYEKLDINLSSYYLITAANRW
jgi:ATP-binding cassette subfamily C (CFTR/MRP) protein 1